MAQAHVKLKTIDVPQADSLALVRRLLEVVRQGQTTTVKDLAELSGFSERHVRYRTQAARILGFLAVDTLDLTSRAERLLATKVGSPEEKSELRKAVAQSPAVRQIAPDLLSMTIVDIKALGSRIAALSGLSPATAERRAVVLRAWHRDLS